MSDGNGNFERKIERLSLPNPAELNLSPTGAAQIERLRGLLRERDAHPKEKVIDVDRVKLLLRRLYRDELPDSLYEEIRVVRRIGELERDLFNRYYTRRFVEPPEGVLIPERTVKHWSWYFDRIVTYSLVSRGITMETATVAECLDDNGNVAESYWIDRALRKGYLLPTLKETSEITATRAVVKSQKLSPWLPLVCAFGGMAIASFVGQHYAGDSLNLEMNRFVLLGRIVLPLLGGVVFGLLVGMLARHALVSSTLHRFKRKHGLGMVDML